MATRLLITPFVLHHISIEEYGLWGFCFAILTYLGISFNGSSTTYIKYIAKYKKNNDFEKINKLLSSGTFILSVFLFFCFILLILFTNFIIDNSSITPSLQEKAKNLLLFCAIVMIITNAFSGFYSGLIAINKAALAKTIWFLCGIMEIGCILLFLQNGYGIYGLAYAYLIQTFVQHLFLYIYLKKYIPEIKFRPKYIKFSYIKKFLVFGGKIQCISILIVVLYSLDRIILTNFLGLESTGLYELGRKFPFAGSSLVLASQITILPLAATFTNVVIHDITPKKRSYVVLTGFFLFFSSITSFFIYSITTNAFAIIFNNNLYLFLSSLILAVGILLTQQFYKLMKRNDYAKNEELKQLYLNSSRYTYLGSFILLGFLGVFSNLLIYIWLGPGYITSSTIMLLLSFSTFIHVITGPGTQILKAINRIGREFEYIIAKFTLGVIWTITFTHLFGIYGTAIAFFLCNLFATSFFIHQINRFLQVPFKTYFFHVITPCLSLGAICLFLYAVSYNIPLTNRLHTFFIFSGLGVLYFALVYLFVINRSLTSDEKQQLFNILKKQKA